MLHSSPQSSTFSNVSGALSTSGATSLGSQNQFLFSQQRKESWSEGAGNGQSNLGPNLVSKARASLL